MGRVILCAIFLIFAPYVLYNIVVMQYICYHIIRIVIASSVKCNLKISTIIYIYVDCDNSFNG